MKKLIALTFLFVVACAAPAPIPTPIPTTSLLVFIEAKPYSGVAPLQGVDVTAVVSGTATGMVTYRFDCTSDGIWEMVMVTQATTFTAADLCNYTVPGNYTITVRVERGNLGIQSTVAVEVRSPALTPVLNVALAPDTPASQDRIIGEDTAVVDFVKVLVTARNSDIKVETLLVKREGGRDSNFVEIMVFDGSTKIGSGYLINGEVAIPFNLWVAKESNKTLTIKAWVAGISPDGSINGDAPKICVNPKGLIAVSGFQTQLVDVSTKGNLCGAPQTLKK